MKIAIDIRTAGGEKTGKGWYTFNIVRNLLQLDTENEYILYCKDLFAGFEEFKNAKMKQVSGKGIHWHYKVARDVKKEKADIFFAPSSYITPSLLPKSIKKIITIHDLVAFLFPQRHNKKAVMIERIFLRRSVKKADHIITVSKNTQKDVLKKFKCDPNKITTIYNAAAEKFKPIDKSELASFQQKTNLPPKFFLAVGTIEPRKNYPTLIRAMSIVVEKYPDTHLIIVGRDGWQYEEVYQEINRLYLQKKVHTLGYLSETSLVNLYNLAEALVFPSYYEGFGIPPLEAMKCGCPVIASFTSSIPEVVGDSGLLVNPESEIALASEMMKILQDDDLRVKLSNKGLIQSKQFSWKKSAEKLFEIIKKCQNTPR